MVSTAESRYNREQISVWLRGLLTIAWADGHFDDVEKNLIAEVTKDELTFDSSVDALEPITPEELSATLGHDANIAENFLRTAVMVAIADGVYSDSEDTVLRQFCTALGQQPTILDSLRQLLFSVATESSPGQAAATVPIGIHPDDHHLAVLTPVQEWLDHLEVHDPKLARFLCKMIPPQCPFERDVNLFGRKIAHIPPLCKLNPLYEQLVGLRFRALSYLADDCGEDVTPYC
ncbi:MAG TPA: Mo-dependent nitrogenase C-terminal domain-containing protein [Crinalium sp.]